MNIGDKYENGGRILIVDAILPNGKYLTHVIGKVGEVPQEAELKQENADELSQEDKKEELKESLEENPAETPTEEPKAEEFKCQHCGQVCKSKTGLIAHEKACKGNPVNK